MYPWASSIIHFCYIILSIVGFTAILTSLLLCLRSLSFYALKLTHGRTTVNKIYYRLDVIKNITANNNSFILYMILTKVDQNNECSNNCIRHGDTMFLLEVTIKDTFNFNRHVSSCLS